MFEYELFATAWGHGGNTENIKNELNRLVPSAGSWLA